MKSTYSSYVLLAAVLASLCFNGQALPASTDMFTLTSADQALNAKIDALESKEKRLIKTSPNEPAKWMTQKEIFQLQKAHHGFMDVTSTGDEETITITQAKTAFPSKLTQQEKAKDIMSVATTALMEDVLLSLTKFNNRYYKSTTGKQSSDWLFGKVQEIITKNNADPSVKVSVKQFTHSGWDQKSIIARIEGSQKPTEVIIVGAHQDSIGGFMNKATARAPGGDDDGSGSVTILEAFRALLVKGFKPAISVEFHWYSGEEAGLLGSQAIASDYKSKKVDVKAMLQLDMTGFPNSQKPDIGFVTDYTDSGLTELLRKMAKEYTTLPIGDFQCGYGCSDHASWNKQGYPSAIPFESSNMEENGNIHTAKDTYESVNFKHALNFAKLAIGYVVELAL